MFNAQRTQHTRAALSMNLPTSSSLTRTKQQRNPLYLETTLPANQALYEGTRLPLKRASPPNLRYPNIYLIIPRTKQYREDIVTRFFD